jgi:hypothetical protein
MNNKNVTPISTRITNAVTNLITIGLVLTFSIGLVSLVVHMIQHGPAQF